MKLVVVPPALIRVIVYPVVSRRASLKHDQISNEDDDEIVYPVVSRRASLKQLPIAPRIHTQGVYPVVSRRASLKRYRCANICIRE